MKKEYTIPKLKDFNFAKSRDKGVFLAPFLNRPLSKIISWTFVHFSLNAELLALFTPLTDLIAIYSIYSGNWILAAILIELSLLFDSADGEVARFRATIDKKRTEHQGQYGAYMDSMAGVLILPLVIFATGYFMNSIMAGLLAMLSFCLLNLSTANSYMFSNKKQKSEKLQEGLLGKIKNKLHIRGVIGFTGDVQKHWIFLVLLFQSITLLWAFTIISMILVFLKFWIYRR